MTPSRSEMQFLYWDEKRKGLSQSDISRKHGITRQTVSKAVKNQQREVLVRLLDIAQVSSILPEWYDVDKGILIGTIPLLGNSPCLLIIDGSNRTHLFYDPGLYDDEEKKVRTIDSIERILKESICRRTDGKDFRAILDMIVRGG